MPPAPQVATAPQPQSAPPVTMPPAPAAPAPATAAPFSGAQPIPQPNQFAQNVQTGPPVMPPAAPTFAPAALGVYGNGAVPAYALPAAHNIADTQSVLSMVIAILSLPAGLFVPIVGIVLAVISIVLATLSRRSSKKTMGTIGIVVSVITLLISFAIIAYNVSQLNKPAKVSSMSQSLAVASVETPCYNINFVTIGSFKVEQKGQSCALRAYDGNTAGTSNKQYVVTSTNVPGETSARLEQDAKRALPDSLNKYYPDFTVNRQGADTFAGSPAYTVYASKGGVALVMTAVLHQSPQGDNLFILLHSGPGSEVNLRQLETAWRWK